MKIAVLLIALFAAGCTQSDRSRRLLSQQGYTNIEITGYRLFSCSEDDSFHTGFRAVTPTGATVEGTVCAGLFFKGATIRFD